MTDCVRHMGKGGNNSLGRRTTDIESVKLLAMDNQIFLILVQILVYRRDSHRGIYQTL